MSAPSLPVEVEAVRRRLAAGNGGYEIVHASPGLEVGVYVLVVFARGSRSAPLR